MAQYHYRAKQGLLKTVDGVVEADTEEGAIARIIQMGYTPLDVRVSGEILPESSLPAQGWSAAFFHRVTAAELTIFTRLLADLIDAGLPVFKALRVIERQSAPSRLKEVIALLCASVQDGTSLSTALAQHPRVFSSMYVNMVKAGEASGKLNEVLERLSEFLEKDQAFRSHVNMSLAYPGLILLVGSLTIFVVLAWVIPRIAVIFDDMGTALPLPTVILLGICGFLAAFWPVILGVIAAGGVYLRKVMLSVEGKLKVDAFILKMPLIGPFLQDAELGRFTRTMGTLLDNGVVILSALQSSTLVLDNDVLRQAMKKIEAEVGNGDSLTNAFKRSSLFPETAIGMIAVGEETGNVHKGLYKLAGFYERETQRVIKTVTSLIEPVLILVIGAIVAFIVMAMLLPIFRINQLIQ